MASNKKRKNKMLHNLEYSDIMQLEAMNSLVNLDAFLMRELMA